MQASGNGALGAGQFAGGLAARFSAEVAEHDCGSQAIGKPGEFLINDTAKLGKFRLRDGFTRGGIVHCPRHFAPPTSGRGELRLVRGPHGHAVEPVTDEAWRLNGFGLANQHQEDGLERILGIVPVREQPPADSEHNGSVTAE